jgi:hypothetical protein
VKKIKLKSHGTVGRPPAVTEKDVRLLLRVNTQLVRKANLRYGVTVKMLRKAAKIKASERAILDAFRARNIKFRPFREKPDLTTQDVKDRLAFGGRNLAKTPAAWVKSPDMTIDNKKFAVYLNGKARDFAARRRARGAFRGPGQGLAKGFVKPRSYLPTYTGAGGGKAVNICAGIARGRVAMWHEVTGTWTGQQAAAMYSGPMLTTLKKVYPARAANRRARWLIQEDNDPTGYKSGAALRAKRSANIRAMSMPKRSPDLNVLDYRIWADITRRMRLQEQSWPQSKRETRAEYKARLRRTALRTSKAFVQSAVKDMARRCALLVQEKGWHFEE